MSGRYGAHLRATTRALRLGWCFVDAGIGWVRWVREELATR